MPTAVLAQDDVMSFGEDEVAEGGAAEEGAVEDFTAEGGAEGGAEGEAAEGGEAGAAGGEAASESDVLSALEEDPDLATTGEPVGPTAEAVEEGAERHPIWAVQQVYALRARRVDLQPSFGVSMNDPYMQHQSISLAAAYYITEVLGVGLSFNWYRFLENQTDLNFSVSRATHQTVPINEYFWGGQINFTYVPLYGKFALAKEWILHWDVWILGGGGFIFTRPVAVIDPEYRSFEYNMKFCFNIGIGGRLYLTRFAAIYVELRDYIFPEELENLETFSTPDERSDKGRWVDDNYKLTNNVMLHIGVSLFLPFTFEYKLPK
jgi:outer membrane beta-barrel protein